MNASTQSCGRLGWTCSIWRTINVSGCVNVSSGRRGKSGEERVCGSGGKMGGWWILYGGSLPVRMHTGVWVGVGDVCRGMGVGERKEIIVCVGGWRSVWRIVRGEWWEVYGGRVCC